MARLRDTPVFNVKTPCRSLKSELQEAVKQNSTVSEVVNESERLKTSLFTVREALVVATAMDDESNK